MKVYIITIHHIHNFGSCFQAWALSKYLIDKGYDCELIDYRPAYFNYGRSKLKTLVGRALNYSSYCRQTKKYDDFIRKNDVLTSKVYTTLDELKNIECDEDTVLISGGDQLWNDFHPCGKDSAYKLSFARRGRKIAYGTSMGRSNYKKEEIEKLVREIKDFESIMLRESSSVQLLSPYVETEVLHVIDPVGLLSISDFESIAVKPKIKERYAVMYLAASSPILDSAIEVLSKQMGLKIVHICGFKKKCKCDYFLKDLGPEEILGYIMHAEYVLSASFHATMFSIMFNKQFASILPGENTNARIEDMLRYFKLENRIINSANDLSHLHEIIDFSGVNIRLEAFKSESEENLIAAIKRKGS